MAFPRVGISSVASIGYTEWELPMRKRVSSLLPPQWSTSELVRKIRSRLIYRRPYLIQHDASLGIRGNDQQPKRFLPYLLRPNSSRASRVSTPAILSELEIMAKKAATSEARGGHLIDTLVQSNLFLTIPLSEPCDFILEGTSLYFM